MDEAAKSSGCLLYASLEATFMAFVWSIYDRVSDVLGAEASGLALVIAIVVAFYFFMGAARPST